MATLEDVIPDANKRKPIYQVFAALGIILTAVQVGFSAAELAQPVYLTVALSVYAFLAGAGFVLAAGNAKAVDDGKVTTWVEPPEVEQVPTAGSDPEQINLDQVTVEGKHAEL